MALDLPSDPDLAMLRGNLETRRTYAVRTADGFVWLGWAAFTEFSATRITLRLRRSRLDGSGSSPLFDLVLEGKDRARILHDRESYLPCRVAPGRAPAEGPAILVVPDPADDAPRLAPQVVRFERGGLVFGPDRLPLWVGPST